MAVEITEEFVWQSIPPRARDSHKGTFGSVLAVAGSAFYRGAALLAAEGALRTGAGIVTLASVEPVVSAAAARLPEWPCLSVHFLYFRNASSILLCPRTACQWKVLKVGQRSAIMG